MGKEKTQFKKGQSGNPSGRPKELPEFIQARKLNRIELEAVLNRLVTPRIEEIIQKVVDNAIETGDPRYADFLLNRLVGKVPDKIDMPPNPVSLLSDEEKLAKAKLAVEILSKRLKADE
jgi:hypothetical protein